MSIATNEVDQALAGDQQVFMGLLEPELRGAYRLAAGMLRNAPEAEDAVQDAVLKAWQHFGRFRRDAELRPWFFKIVANECRSRRRSRWWSVARGLPDHSEDVSTGPGDDPAVADLRRALRRLPFDQRFAIVLRYYLDLSFEEVAQTMGTTVKAAQSRIYRGLKSLRLTPEVMSNE